MSLATKYRPKTFSEISEQPLVVKMVEACCSESGEMSNRNFLFIGPAGTGKAQPLDSKILTPSGFIEMKDVQIGTEVFTAKGNIAHVTGIFPQGVRPIYEIEIQDGTVIRVSDEHLNVFYRYNEDRKQRQDYCMTTLDMISLFQTSRFKLRVDTPIVDWPEANLPIDPYLLGALIGDGSLSSGNFAFSNSEPDVVAKVNDILLRDWGMILKKCPGDNVDYSITMNQTAHSHEFIYKSQVYHGIYEVQEALARDGYPKFDIETIRTLCDYPDKSNTLKHYPELYDMLSYKKLPHTQYNYLRQILKEMNLLCKSTEKYIPSQYLFASYNQRLRLLQGLFDTDGCISRGATDFSTCSPKLSEDFAFLVRSLGIRDTVRSYPSSYKKKGSTELIYTGTTSYNHSLKITNGAPFYTSEKHSSRYRDRQNPPIRNIVDIRLAGEEECQCIMLDHEDHTYISDGFIPTHNTTTCRIVASTINDGNGEAIEVDAASHNGVDSVREIVQQASSYPIGTKYKVFILDEVHAFSQQAWQILLKTLEESPAKSVFLMATTNPEKIPATILSRVQTFQLSKISLDGIISRLKYIIECENKEGKNITYEDAAISYIAKLANGGMRDAITLLEKALAYDTNITSEGLVKALNLPQYDDYFALLSAYAKHDNTAVAQIIHTVYNSGVNFIKWFEGFHAFVMNVVKFIFLQDIQATMIPAQYAEKVAPYGPKHSVVCLKLANKLLKLNADLKATQYLQETALTYLCTTPRKEQ